MADYNPLALKKWSVEDRPREKLIKMGVGHLSNAELIALLLGSGTRKMNAVELGRLILTRTDNDLHELGRLSIEDLQQINGIGKAKAIILIAAFELASRKNNCYAREKVVIRNSQSAFEIMQPRLGPLEHEEFWIIILNRAHKVLNTVKISQGGLTGTVIDTRMILKHALDKKATALIVCHNHPSGNIKPSEADIGITKKIRDAAELMDITLLDHLIIADRKYFSFADEGMVI